MSATLPADASGSLATAIHVGAGSVSLLVAEPTGNGTYRAVDFLEQPAPLARDVFRHGHISAETTERIVTILKDYQNALAEYGADGHAITRAVATNILVEATNYDIFLNRIRIACGFSINPIDDGEMTRLIYLKTRRRLKDTPAMRRSCTLVVHVGPGNTRALLFQDGAISRYTSYRLGTHRTREATEGSHAEGAAMLRVIREHTSGNLAQMKFDYSDVELEGLVVIGYEIQQIARQLSKSAGAHTLKSLKKMTMEAAQMSDLDLVTRYQIDYQTAEALLPALETNLAIAEIFGLKEVHIPASDYEQGILQDLLVSSSLAGTLDQEVLRSARILALRYQSDPRHGEHVAKICQHLFSELQDLHRMSKHDAMLLQVAAILHEVGTFVSPRAHHKHSEYIILNSEIFGLDRRDINMVAMISRYHRHSGPRIDHPNYHDLDTVDRIRVAKLSSLLRVADALERTHEQRVADILVRRDERRLRLGLPGVTDAAVERLAMASKGDLFEQVFGLEVVIDDAGG
ncbi:HD domain-containing protein [Haloferula sp. BvORR071]|uniref:Ppx/GppA phosphatase family protein n=1 Tax=Haloferula sp. BvORR071 TaxID=1396141 RepID=UPI000552CD59|nr:HD domain-containing protein [Haloferula sp. BvORR071]